jgi:hypothetical protein
MNLREFLDAHCLPYSDRRAVRSNTAVKQRAKKRTGVMSKNKKSISRSMAYSLEFRDLQGK